MGPDTSKFAYIALVKDSKAAVKEKHKELKQAKKAQRMKEDMEQRNRQDNFIKRSVNILTFTWMFVQALLDGLIELLNSIAKDYIDISTVLSFERSILRRELKQGKLSNQETVHHYYNAKLKCQAPCNPDGALERDESMEGEQASTSSYHKMASFDSMLSRDSSVSSCNTEVTIMSLKPTSSDCADDVEEPVSVVPKPSNRNRWRLQKMLNIDIPSSLDCEPPSTLIQCARSSNWQGTTDTIEEEADEEVVKDIITPQSYHPPSYNAVANSYNCLDLSEENVSMESDEEMSKMDHYNPLSCETHLLTASDLLLNKVFHDVELEESDKFYRSLPPLLKLLFALYNTMVSQSDMLCYFVMILNHMVSASVLTMVLPILVFLWAMLSVPRPKKRFWMLAILYTECHGLWDSHDAVKEQHFEKMQKQRNHQNLGETQEGNESMQTVSLQDTEQGPDRKNSSRQSSERVKAPKRSRKKKRESPKAGKRFRETVKEQIREKAQMAKRYITVM
ncbi:hypothetical protein chiPu_0015637 [Chiloscyllium punctatum]|uniref:Piezo transmembrane helical unit domain-containing protein n=1 Tax=Chiloscyllium punctatum TaxID=137246 RepID=A0A401T393_CHIPU|nr:hypothetical protein [Chiloscyllium punctatum]